MNTEELRARFEAVMRENNFRLDRRDEGYDSHPVNCMWFGWKAAHASLVASTPAEPVAVVTDFRVNHDEALQLAYLKRDESNLARCYIALRTAPPVSTDDVKILRSALNAMLTHMGMDEDEWNAATFSQARSALAATKPPSEAVAADTTKESK